MKGVDHALYNTEHPLIMRPCPSHMPRRQPEDDKDAGLLHTRAATSQAVTKEIMLFLHKALYWQETYERAQAGAHRQ